MEQEKLNDLVRRLRMSNEKPFRVGHGITIKPADREWYANQIEELADSGLPDEYFGTEEDVVGYAMEVYQEIMGYYDDLDEDDMENLF